MKYMLDTNILIYLLKNSPASVAQRVDRIGADDQMFMSYVTYAELLLGAERSAKSRKVLQKLSQVIRRVPVLYSLDQRICEHYAKQFARLKVAGLPIGANDLWIACHALAENAVLVTHNTREFRRIAGLKVEDWAEP